MKLKGHRINGGRVEGEAIVCADAFSFLGDFDPTTGNCLIKTPGLEGKSMIDKVLVCPTGKGSSRGPLNTYRAMKLNKSPRAIVCIEAEPVLAAAAMVANMPMVDRLDKNPLEVIKTGDWVKVDGDNGIVEVIRPGNQ
jgi:predicted aconitase with swiveling domain